MKMELRIPPNVHQGPISENNGVTDLPETGKSKIPPSTDVRDGKETVHLRSAYSGPLNEDTVFSWLHRLARDQNPQN
jgi:hypothetical protein